MVYRGKSRIFKYKSKMLIFIKNMVYRGKSRIFYSIRTEIPVPLSFIGDIVDKSYLQFQGAGEQGAGAGAGSRERGAGSSRERGAGSREQGAGAGYTLYKRSNFQSIFYFVQKIT